MINGYVNFEELQIITGFSCNQLYCLLKDGLTLHELSYSPLSMEGGRYRSIKEELYNLDEVMKWLSIHIY